MRFRPGEKFAPGVNLPDSSHFLKYKDRKLKGVRLFTRYTKIDGEKYYYRIAMILLILI